MLTDSGATSRSPCERKCSRHWRRAPLIIVSCLLSGCGLGYVGQAAHGQWQVIAARRPVNEVIADPTTDAALARRLRLVQEARDFASRELQLPDNRSYRTFADLHRPYVVWNVVGAPEFSVAPLQWCFPFTGCIAYRGYFHEAAARAFAAKLERAGNDVQVSGISAYSTLGHFADPVLNTMLGYGDLDLVGTIFHELAHQLIYVAGDSKFDESFAMAVEQEGLARWLATRGRSAELAGYLQHRTQEFTITNRLAEGRHQLAAFYRDSAALPVEVRRVRKRQLLTQIGNDVTAYEQQIGLRTGYDAWIKAGLNNADLAAVGTYFDCIPAFNELLAQNHGDLPTFYAAVRRLAHAKAARRQFCASGL